MVFKDKKIPKHLIIKEEYEFRQRPRFGVFKFVFVCTVVVGLTYAISIGVIQV